MAETIYRFIVESQETRNANETTVDTSGRRVAKKGAGTKVYTGSNKGVEHNRYMRVVNPTINRYTGGYWEQSIRLGRASTGVVDVARNKGMSSAMTSVGAIILLQFVVRAIEQWWEKEKKKAREENQANYLKIRSGETLLSNDYKINRNIFGKITYKNQ